MENVSLIYARYSVLIFNVFFALTGSIMMAISCIIYSEFLRYEHLTGDHFWMAAALLICASTAVFLIATLCSCGAIKENSHIILTFLFLFALIFSFEIGTSVAIYTKKSHLNETLEDSFQQMLTDHTDNVNLWSSVQSQMKCCGIHSPDDWIKELNSTILPASCCPDPTNSTSSETDCTKEDASQHGCKPILVERMKSLTTILAGVGLGIGWLQIVVIGYACCVYFVFRKNYAQYTERLL